MALMWIYITVSCWLSIGIIVNGLGLCIIHNLARWSGRLISRLEILKHGCTEAYEKQVDEALKEAQTEMNNFPWIKWWIKMVVCWPSALVEHIMYIGEQWNNIKNMRRELQNLES